MSTAVYYRVSTDSQDVAAQRHAVQQWLAIRGITEYAAYTDVASGKHDDRPEFQRLCADVRARAITAVVVWRLDRVSRKATTALATLIEWINVGAEFWAVDQPMFQLGKDNPFRLTFLAMFSELAQLEREAIVSRVRSGMAAAKARGVKLGKSQTLTAQQAAALRAQIAAGDSVVTAARQYGISRATAYRYVGGKHVVSGAVTTDDA